MTKPFIAIDWGTTSFRAYKVDGDGTVREERSDKEGILAVTNGDFEAVLEKHLHGWDHSLPVIAAGMITSRQGWIELPYVDCPAGPEELAKSMHIKVLASKRRVHFLTGLHLDSASLGHDVMRSEETQVFGSLVSGAKHFVTPGTHSKWIDVVGSRITNFSTYVTGEAYAVLLKHSILGRLMNNDQEDKASFLKGVDMAFADPAGLLHSLFSVRSLGLYKAIPAEHLSSYLSGIVIGTEVAHAISNRDRNATYVILASPGIGAKYLTAMQTAGLNAVMGDPLAIVKGEAMVAKAAGVI